MVAWEMLIHVHRILRRHGQEFVCFVEQSLRHSTVGYCRGLLHHCGPAKEGTRRSALKVLRTYPFAASGKGNQDVVNWFSQRGIGRASQ